MFSKDPSALLDYTVDWGSGGWLPTGDSLASATWSTVETTLSAPLDLIADGISGEGGSLVDGTHYYWVVTATNSAGETTPNPLTDELTADAKAELAAMFAELRLRYEASRPKRLRAQLIPVATVRTGW